MPHSFLVVGLGCGDETKGATVDYLVRRYGLSAVIRYNGGSQAAHNVVTPDGVHHCFSQFGSGTLVPRVRTYLSRYMAVEPIALEREQQALRAIGTNDAYDRLVIDERAPLITPANRLLNQLQETARGSRRHGSCGKGVGITLRDHEVYGDQAPVVGDLLNPTRLRDKLYFFWHMRLDQAEQLCDQTSDEAARAYLGQLQRLDWDHYLQQYQSLAQRLTIRPEEALLDVIAHHDCAFEGAQGVVIGPECGFYPHITRGSTTLHQAEILIEAAGTTDVERVGVLRGYATRHGAGPLITEDASLKTVIAPCHNTTNPWQGELRLGWFDAVMSRYALAATGGVDWIALNNLDCLRPLPSIRICTAYDISAVDPVLRQDYFGTHDDRTSLISQPIPPNTDPGRLAAITASRPIYQSVALDQHDPGLGEYIRYLQALLATPIRLASFGPKATDRIPIAL